MNKLLSALILGFSAQSFAADTIKIAITGPFTGGSAPMGVSMRDGARLAIAEINADGGIAIGGRKLKIEAIERDDEAKNDRGALIAQELAAMDDLSGVIGTVNTGVAIAGDKFLAEKGITKIITPAAGTAAMAQWANRPGRPGPAELSIFRFSAHDGLQSAMVVEEALKLGASRVAILHDATNYGVSGRDDLLAKISAQGGKLQVVATEKFNVGDKDMTAQLLKARGGGAQAILIWGIGPELAAVANDMDKLGMKMPLIGGWTLSMSNFIDNAGNNGNGTLMPQSFIEEGVTPQSRAFIEQYHRAYQVSRIPSPMSAAQGYDAVLLFAAAVQQAQSTDTRRIRRALEDLQTPVPGVIATWKHPFAKWDPADESTHEAFHPQQVVMGMVRDGRVVFASAVEKRHLETGERRPSHALLQLVVSGALMGLVYALLAYGFQLTFATSRSINFGQGELVMVSAFISLTLLGLGVPYWLMVPLGLASGALLGLAVERVAVRLALEQRSEGWILLTIISGLFLFSMAENIWGRDDRPFPTPLSGEPLQLFGIGVTPVELSVALGVFAVMGLIELFKRRTLWGKAFEAVAADRDAAELMGISARGTIMLSYGLSGLVAAMAGILVSPLTTVGPTMASALILKAFAVAVVAGLESGFGVVLVGLALGALESLASFYIGSGWREAPGLLLLILALAVRPNGIFGTASLRKV